MTALRITRAGPLCTIQDGGRFGMLRHGISASGPMDAGGYHLAGRLAGGAAGAGIEFTAAGVSLLVEGRGLRAGAAGGRFRLAVNGNPRDWPAALGLDPGDRVDITPGGEGNYGYLRFSRELDVPLVMGSRATNLVAGLGGFGGRALKAGDRIPLAGPAPPANAEAGVEESPAEGPIRIVWGLHAEQFGMRLCRRFLETDFRVSTRIDRMGARLEGGAELFAGREARSLVSDAVVAGDIQILGDGTPIILLRDHQPTGGYPRIATVISADLDRVAQMRPGTDLRFAPLTVARAQALRRGVAW